jgi:hypothetical protein
MPILTAEQQPPFAQFIGMDITEVTPERVCAQLLVREELGNRNGVLHGGALMALADNLGDGNDRQPEGRSINHDHRKQDQFFRRDPGGERRSRRMHAAASRPHHDGLADQGHARGRTPRGDRDADAIGARSEMTISAY